MSDLGKKLQLKDRPLRVLHPPEGFEPAVARAEAGDEDAPLLLFVRDRAELEARVEPLLRLARKDGLAWIAYPKAGQLGTDLNRDSLAELMGRRGVRPVRQIALDDVWSALRFRPEA